MNPTQKRLIDLKPTHDDFINIYQEIVKHEICLMRFNDICTKINEGYYVSRSSFPIVHDVDARMTILDILYIIFKKMSNIIKNYDMKIEDVEKFVNKLVESRLLIDTPCSMTNTKLPQYINIILTNSNVYEISHLENIYMYFYMYNELMKEIKKWNISDAKIKELIHKYEDDCYKSAYGELIRLYRYETPLPGGERKFYLNLENPPYRALEAYVLPYMEEPLPEFKKDLFNKFCEKINIIGNTNKELICNALNNIGIYALHEYQYEMLKDLIDNFNTPKQVTISAPTASGKTEIFMTYIVTKLLNNGGSSLIIYPTKTLAREQLERLIRFLYYINNNNDKKIKVYILDGDSPTYNDIDNSNENLFRNGISIKKNDDEGIIKYANKKLKIEWTKNKISENIDWVKEYKDIENIDEPAIIITNHSMLSTHLAKNSNWIKSLAKTLNLIVIDEAHVFINDKVKSDFLHFLLLRLLIQSMHENQLREEFIDNPTKAIKDLIRSKNLDIILSSATISDRDILPEDITSTQLGGIDLNVAAKGENNPPIDLLLKQIYDIYKEEFKVLYKPYYDTINRTVRKKLIINAIYFPEPMMSSQNLYLEALSTSLIWTYALSSRISTTYDTNFQLHGIGFLDSKETQYEIFKKFVKRGLLEEAFHADKLLVSPLMNNLETNGKEVIKNLIKEFNENPKLIYNDLIRYSHLQLYYPWVNINNYIAHLIYDPDNSKSSVKEVLEFATSVYNASQNYKKYNINENNNYYVVIHNADLDKNYRTKIEHILGGHSNKNWNLVLATSTLELGVNIPGVAFILNYGIPSTSDSFIQRIGRSGRDEKSLRISFGGIFTKNIGKDIILIDENEAIRTLFNLRMPRYLKQLDRYTLVRYMLLIYKDLKNLESFEDINNLIKSILKLYINNVDEQNITNIANEIKDIYNNYIQLINELNTDKLENKNYPFFIIRKNLQTNLGYIRDSFPKNLKGLLTTIEPAIENSKNPNHKLLYQKLLQNINKFIQFIDNAKFKPDIYNESLLEFLNIDGLKILNYIKEANEILNKIIESIKDIEFDNYVINKNKDKIINLLEHEKDVLNQSKDLVIYTILSNKGECNSDNDIALLLNGMIIPHVSTISEIGSCENICDNVDYHDNYIKLNCTQKRNNRSDSLKNIPFKHYEVD